MRIMMKKTGTGAYVYNLSASAAFINEGQSVTFSITSQNVPDGTVLPYNITGISVSDITSGSLTGNLTIVSGAAQVTIQLALDQLTEGNETVVFTLDGKGESAQQLVQLTEQVTVVDLSQTPTYSLSRSLSSVNEGQSVTITVDTTDVFDGTLLPYTVTGISQPDLSSGVLTSNVTIVNNTGNVTFVLAADTLTEGSETLTFTLDAIGSSINVTINDTSTDAPSYWRSTGQTTSGGYTVGLSISKDMSAGTSSSSGSTLTPTGTNLAGRSSYSWSDWGGDIFDQYGFPYVYVNGSYYMVPINGINTADGTITTYTTNLGGIIFQIKQGYPVMGIYKIEIEYKSGAMDGNGFRFGMYGNMGSDQYTTRQYLTSGSGDLGVIYYDRNYQTNNTIESLYTYIIPFTPLGTRPFTSAYSGDNRGIYTNSIHNGVTMYMSKGYNVVDWVNWDIDYV